MRFALISWFCHPGFLLEWKPHSKNITQQFCRRVAVVISSPPFEGLQKAHTYRVSSKDKVFSKWGAQHTTLAYCLSPQFWECTALLRSIKNWRKFLGREKDGYVRLCTPYRPSIFQGRTFCGNSHHNTLYPKNISIF
jgi:hypothetical protein